MRRVVFFVPVASLLLLLALAPRGVLAQSPTQQRELQIQERLKSRNGIHVGEPKVYDDALLQQMLNAAEARLAAIQVLDQAGIVAKLGVISGAEQRTTSIALTAVTPSLPEVTTTEKGATQSVTKKESASPATTDTTSGAATTDVITKSPQTAAPTATPSAPTMTMPTNVSVSASDLLNEQMQLTFEIANLRLLLDGALSDRLFSYGDNLHRLKRRHTIGIPIDIDPRSDYKDAVAIVEVEVERKQTLANDAEISLTALLPREKTYNVAAIRESNLNLGGGVITQVVGVGGGFLKSRKTYYIVQDQDTIAQTFDPETDHSIGIAWQFRPVLGQQYVRPRQTQTFVQLAFPALDDATDFARVRVRSYWREYDRKHGVVKGVIKGSLNEKFVNRKSATGDVVETSAEWSIPTFATTIPTLRFNQTNLEDLGGGQMLVSVPTRLLPGTSLRIGATIYREGVVGVVFSPTGIKFAASISDLATKPVALVGRDGQETPLEISRLTKTTPETPAPAPSIARVSARPLDDTTSLVDVELAADLDEILPPQILVIGGRAFGYSDAPIVRNRRSFTAVVPTALIQANPTVQITALFAPAGYRASKEIEGAGVRARVERLVLLAEADGQSKYLLYGSRLAGARVLVPAGASLGPVPGTPSADADAFALVTAKSDSLKGLKQIVLQRSQERPIFIALPSSSPSSSNEASKKPEPKARERVVVNADVATFDSDGLAGLTSVSFEKKPLTMTVAQDKKSVLVSSLRAAGATASAGSVNLDFVFGDTKVQAKLDVVSARVETVAK